MANTYSNCYYHLVFSTKDRRPYIAPEIEERVWAYIGGISRKHGFTAIQVGGMPDHSHSLIGAPPKVSPSDIAQRIKGDSSYWMRREFPQLADFAWQDGYGVFTVSKSAIPPVVDYIRNQKMHHQNRSFEDEYVELLRLHEIEYDKRYLFG